MQSPASDSDEDAERPPPGLVLASEALREDLAPVEPGRRSGRLIVTGVGGALALLGLSMRAGIDEPGSGGAASISFAAAGVACALCALPFGYALRGAAVGALGTALFVLGATGVGPAALSGGARTPEFARLVALAVLPGALLFRAHYRAYPKARVALAVALVAALPFVATRSLVALDFGAPVFDRVGALVAAATVLGGCFGFMGAYTTGGGSVWAALVLGALSLDIATRTLSGAGVAGAGAGHGLLRAGAAAVGTGCAGTLLAVGVYHLLSAWLGGDARTEARKQAAESPA